MSQLALISSPNSVNSSQSSSSSVSPTFPWTEAALTGRWKSTIIYGRVNHWESIVQTDKSLCTLPHETLIAALESVGRIDTFVKFWNLCCNVLDILPKLDDKHPYHCPRLSSVSMKHMKDMALNVFAYDIKDRDYETGNHILYTGSKGVGKSHLLRTACLLFSLITQTVDPFYVDCLGLCDISPPISIGDVMTNAFQLATSARLPVLSTYAPSAAIQFSKQVLNAYLGQKRHPLPFIDELQECYEKRPENWAIVRQMGNTAGSFSVISGSSSKLRCLAYAQTLADVERFGYSTFLGDLNETKFVETILNPLEDAIA